MRSLIIAVSLLVLSACDSSTDCPPGDDGPPASLDTVTEACRALCDWEEACRPDIPSATCAAACVSRMCNAYAPQPAGCGGLAADPAQAAVCIGYVRIEVESSTPRCEIPRAYSDLCLAAFLPPAD